MLIYTHRTGHQPRSLHPQLADRLEHIHHSLSLQPLNEDAHCYVGPSPSTPSTREGEREMKDSEVLEITKLTATCKHDDS